MFQKKEWQSRFLPERIFHVKWSKINQLWLNKNCGDVNSIGWQKTIKTNTILIILQTQDTFSITSKHLFAHADACCEPDTWTQNYHEDWNEELNTREIFIKLQRNISKLFFNVFEREREKIELDNNTTYKFNKTHSRKETSDNCTTWKDSILIAFCLKIHWLLIAKITRTQQNWKCQNIFEQTNE